MSTDSPFRQPRSGGVGLCVRSIGDTDCAVIGLHSEGTRKTTFKTFDPSTRGNSRRKLRNSRSVSYSSEKSSFAPPRIISKTNSVPGNHPRNLWVPHCSIGHCNVYISLAVLRHSWIGSESTGQWIMGIFESRIRPKLANSGLTSCAVGSGKSAHHLCVSGLANQCFGCRGDRWQLAWTFAYRVLKLEARAWPYEDGGVGSCEGSTCVHLSDFKKCIEFGGRINHTMTSTGLEQELEHHSLKVAARVANNPPPSYMEQDLSVSSYPLADIHLIVLCVVKVAWCSTWYIVRLQPTPETLLS